jgi:hypothetical protein
MRPSSNRSASSRSRAKRDPVHAYRLIALTAAAPAFEARQDAPLVGRKRELAALRRALKRAVDGGSTQVAVVIGSPGVANRVWPQSSRGAREA